MAPLIGAVLATLLFKATDAQSLIDAGIAPERIFLSMERNMRCAVGHCGHCQLGPTMICRDGPVYRYDRLERLMAVHEL